MTIRPLGVAALGLLASACAGTSPHTGPPAGGRGTLFIVGGGEQPTSMVQQFVDLAGGSRARIAVVPMASGSPAEAGREKAEQFRGLGAAAFVLDLTRAQAQGDSSVRLVGGATAIWFGGGDQERLAAVLQGTPVLEAIRRRWLEGAVVGGTSAGAAVMSDSMMNGNQRRAGEDTVGYFGDEFPSIAREAIQIVPGFGFLPHAIVDQHFIRRERHNRLFSVVLERPSLIGVGIDESTALLVDPDGRWRVTGESAVLIVDGRDARISAAGAPVLGAAGLHVHLLPAGSVFDPRTGVARIPPAQ